MIPGGQGYGISQKSFSGSGSTQLMKVIKMNMSKHGAQAVVTAVATPIAFKFARKIFRRPIRVANKMLKGSGVRV